jgi:hypothetical protein
MANTYAGPMIRLVQRLCMILTLSCCAYMVYFLFSKKQDNSMTIENNDVSSKDTGLLSLSPVIGSKPQVSGDNVQARDIFSLTAEVSPSGNVENTPKGQLPAHLKVVGILISHPSQIIIENAFEKKTYFIDEGGSPQDGIKIVRVGKDQMIINYQGEEISVPVSKY